MNVDFGSSHSKLNASFVSWKFKGVFLSEKVHGNIERHIRGAEVTHSNGKTDINQKQN